MTDQDMHLKISEPLTWDDLADAYDEEHSSRPARTLRMETVFEWATKQHDKFFFSSKQGTLHRILPEEDQ